MNKTVIETLRREKTLLQAKLNAVNQLLLAYDEAAAQGSAFAPTRGTRLGRDYGIAIRSIARELILSAGNEPQSLKAISDAVIARGVIITGNTPTSNLSALLSNSSWFESVRGKGWRLRSAAIAEADKSGD